MKKILAILPKKRQTILFSATQTEKTIDLIKLSFRSKPIFINVDANSTTSTADHIEQGFVVVDQAQKFILLFSFLKRNKTKKNCCIFFYL